MLYVENKLQIKGFNISRDGERKVTLKVSTGDTETCTTWVMFIKRSPRKQVYDITFAGELKLKYKEEDVNRMNLYINRESDTLISFSSKPVEGKKYYPLTAECVKHDICEDKKIILAFPQGVTLKSTYVDTYNYLRVTYHSEINGEVEMALEGVRAGYVYYIPDNMERYFDTISFENATNPMRYAYNSFFEVNLDELERKVETYSLGDINLVAEFPWKVEVKEDVATLTNPSNIIECQLNKVWVREINMVKIEKCSGGLLLKFYRKNKKGKEEIQAMLPVRATQYKGAITANCKFVDVFVR